MKNLPLGIQTFRDFINENYLYVDKTQVIYNLFARGGQYFLFTRPRRFGKSVLVSTLAEIFSGNKELFKGLWIYDKIEWTKHPIIYLDFSKISFKTPEILEKSLENRVDEIAADNHIELTPNLFLNEKFARLIKQMSQAKQQKVVILIDEYDKPIISFMEQNHINTALEMRQVLKHFFGVIKGSDEYLRFVFITGVSKFSKVSIFSDLNNLRDITLSREFTVLLGYTEAELKHYFAPYIKELAEQMEITEERLLEDIKEWYDGYSWDGENFVYNPYSIINLFTEKKFGNFWFATGTPTFLIHSIETQKSDVLSFDNIPVNSYIFDSYDVGNIEIPVLLFQTGYLTIKKITVKNRLETYHLSYPNKEVQDSLMTHLFDAFTRRKMSLSTQLIAATGEALEKGDIDAFILQIKSLFASIPHQIFIDYKEAYYHTVIYLLLNLAGARVSVEESTNIGRIDALLETPKEFYIMEFKMGTAEEAMSQIKAKKYYEKYLGRGKEIVLLGIGFDSQQRNVGNYLLEKA